MKDTFWISIAITACFLIYFVGTDELLKRRQEHEYLMKKLELESKYRPDSLQEVQWRESYYKLLKQCHDSGNLDK